MINSDKAPSGELHQADLGTAIDTQQQLREFLQQLSPKQLHELANFAGYLAEAEGETITQELLAIPGLRDRLKKTQPTKPTDP